MKRNGWAIAWLVLLASQALADEIRVVVTFSGTADPSLLTRYGGRLDLELPGIRACSGYVPADRLWEIRRQPGVALVEEDLVRRKTLDPNDTYYATYQAADYGLVRAPEAWNVSRGDGIRVCVLDTGVQLDHPDIGSGTTGKVKVWRNFTSPAIQDVTDMDGHGTHTAGTIAAKSNNGVGVAGIGFNCELAVGKVLGPSGGFDSWIAAGMDWAWQVGGAKVISMSLGAPGTSSNLEAAVNRAWANGVVIVAAAGNDASSELFYPASIANCISVAATDNTGMLASFSNFGSTVDLAAPGVNVASTYKGSSYVLASGTSMACPHVSGAAALVWATSFGTSNTNVRALLEAGATRAVTGVNAGSLKILDIYVTVTGGSPPTSPPDAPTGLVATAGDGTVSLHWNASSGATGYTVRRSTVSGSGFSTIATGITATTYTDAGLSNGTTYYYRVSALNAAGESADSAEVSATPMLLPPAAPTGLAATPGNGQISLSWTAPSGVTSYTVKRSSTSGGPYTPIQTGISGTSIVDTGLVNGATYYYVVTAVNAAGESPTSNEASATPTAGSAAPTGLAAMPIPSRLVLTWNASQGATSYHVKRATVSGGPYMLVATVGATTYISPAPSGGMTTYYVVSALTSSGESGNSNEVAVRP
jgi:subtilisin family serine protease